MNRGPHKEATKGVSAAPLASLLVGLLFCLATYAPQSTTQGASADTLTWPPCQYREIVIWMTLPDKGDTTGNCYAGQGPAINHLQFLQAEATSFSETDTIGGTFNVAGLEGDSVGVAWDIRPGTMGTMRYRVRNDVGWSCWYHYLYLVPFDCGDSIPPPPTGAGLTAEYYDNEDFTGLYDSPIDSMINFVWYNDPPLPGMGPDEFSVRWTGQLRALETGAHTICVEACNGGFRFWLAGSLFSSQDFLGTCGELCAPVGLTAGDRYDAVVETWHTTGTARCRMRWITPSWQDQIVPAEAWR